MSALAELAKRVDQGVWLVEIDAARLVGDEGSPTPTLAIETLMLASRPFVTDAVLDHPPATPVRGRFIPNFSVQWELGASADTGFSSMPSFSAGQMEFENADGALDEWLDLYAVQGREVRVSYAAWSELAGGPAPGAGGDAFQWLDGAGGLVSWTDSTPGGASEVLWTDSTGRGGSTGAGLSAFRRLFKGRVSSWSFSGGRIAVRVEPDARQLDNPIQTNTNDGKGGLGGTPEMAGVTKPVALGICKGVEPKQNDPLLLIFHLNDGPIHGVSDVRDEGISLAFTRDYDSYGLLEAAVQQSLAGDEGGWDIGIGQYATCLAEGAVRLGGPAAGRVVCDVQGSSFAKRVEVPWASGHFWASGHGWSKLDYQTRVEVPWASGHFWASGHGWSAKSAPPFFSGARHMAQRLLIERSGFTADEIDSEGIDHLNGRDPDGSLDPSCGLYLPPGGSMTVREALARLFQSAGVVGFQDRDGVWRVRYVEIPEGPAAVVLEESRLVPGSLERLDLAWPAPWSTWKCAWGRNWTPMTASDLAGGDQDTSFVDPNVRAFSLRAAAYARADDATLAVLYPQKRTGTLETLLTDEAAAELRADQMLALHGGGQALYRARWEGVMGRLGFMDPATTRLPRLGMRDGKTFLVVGVTESAPNRQTELYLYGGGTATVARPVPSVRLASAPPSVSVSATQAVVASFGVALSATSPRDAEVLWSLAGLASADLQTPLSGAVTIKAGVAAASVPVVFAPQALTGDKPATLTLRPLSGCAAGTPLSATITLLANTAPTPAAFLSAGPGSVTPSAAATTTAQAVVTLSAAAATPATLTWTITGLASGDVAGPLSDTVTIAAGQSSAAIAIRLAAQVLASDKSATLTLSAPLGCTLGSPAALGFTLASNLTATPHASVASGPGTVRPAATHTVAGTATLALSPASAATCSVTWTITGLVSGDMAGGSLTGTATFPAGATSLTLPLVFAAQALSADKSATLTISAPSGCVLGSPASVGFTLATVSAPVLPFSSGVAWYYPAAGIATHALSSTWVSRLCQNTEFLVTLRDFTLPVYYASQATTTRTLRNLNPGWHDPVADGATLPWNPAWKPTGGVNWNGSQNTDAMMIILFDVAANGFPAGTEIDLWQVVDGSPAAGSVTCSSATRVPQDYRTGNGRAEVSRKCGLANRAGLGMAAEAAYGRFNHALPLSIPNTETGTPFFVAPAIKSVTTNGVAGGVSMGARFALTMTSTQRDAFVAALPSGVPAGMRAFTRNLLDDLAEYGFIVTDDSGSWHTTTTPATGTGAHFWFEDVLSGQAAWDSIGMGGTVTVNVNGKNKLYPDHLLDGLFTASNLRALVASTSYASVDMPSFTGTFGSTVSSQSDAASRTTHTFRGLITPENGNVAVVVAARNDGATAATVTSATLGGVALTQDVRQAGAAAGLDFVWVGHTTGAGIGTPLDLVVTTSSAVSQVVALAVDVTSAWTGTVGGRGGNISNASLSSLGVSGVVANGANKTWLGVANTMNSSRTLSASGWTPLGSPRAVGSGTTGASNIAQLFYQNSTVAVGGTQSMTAAWTGGASNPSGVVVVEFL